MFLYLNEAKQFQNVVMGDKWEDNTGSHPNFSLAQQFFVKINKTSEGRFQNSC